MSEKNIAVFGAIRRAAEVAREHDRIAWEARVEWNELVCERHDENAEAIRDAIRAAIESPKR